MSGRARPFLRDGERIGYRKTDRRNPRKDPRERMAELISAPSDFPIRLAFQLPKTLEGFVGGARHGLHIETFTRGFVRISHRSAEQCFAEARRFLADIAKERPAFTTRGVIINSEQPEKTYGRHLTVIRGAVVVTAGLIEPRVYE